LALAPLIGFFLLSIPGTKRALYLTPLWPTFGLAMTLWITPWIVGRPASRRWLLAATLGPLLLVNLSCLVSAACRPKRDYRSVVNWLSAEGATGNNVIGFRPDERIRSALPYFSGKTFRQAANTTELIELLSAQPGAKVLLRSCERSRLEDAGLNPSSVGERAVGTRVYQLVHIPQKEERAP